MRERFTYRQMFRHIQLSALAIGVFVGYVVPLLMGALLLVEIYGAVDRQDVELARRMFAIIVVANLAGSVAGGYVAAHLARYQPLLHGLPTAVVGVLLVSPFSHVSLVWTLTYFTGAIAGAWLRSRT